MRRLRTLALTALIALGGAGCFGGWFRGYPPDWPRSVSSARGCPDVSGTWENQAIDDPFVFDPVPLIDAIRGEPTFQQFARRKDSYEAFEQARIARAAVRHVRLAQPTRDTLEVAIVGEGSQEEPVALRRGRDFSCEDGVLTVHIPLEQGNANVCGVGVGRRTELARDVAGDLLAHVRKQEICIGLLVNVLVFNADWARYREADPQRSQARP